MTGFPPMYMGYSIALVLLHSPGAFKIQDEAFHPETRKGALQETGSVPQLSTVMLGFGFRISLKAARQPTVGSAIGMQHQDRAVGSMQADRLLDLIQHERAVELLVGGSERLGASGDLDRVGLNNPDALEQLSANRVEAIVEATHHRPPTRRSDI